MSFAEAWREAVRFRHVSPVLEAYVASVHELASAQPADLPALKAALEQMLAFLATRDGMTDANCCAVDAFFSSREGSWEHLPAGYRALLDAIGGTLHDSVYAPEIARTFESLPHQLLERARRLMS